MWGSSYLFIKLAVDSFGDVHAGRAAAAHRRRVPVGRAPAQPDAPPARPSDLRPPARDGVINIAIPFTLITWAEQSVDSALAAILNATVPLFVIVIAPLFLPDEPIRVNGVRRPGRRVHRRRADRLAGAGRRGRHRARRAGAARLVVHRTRSATSTHRRNVRGLPPLIPAVFQVTFALLIVGALALVLERPWETAQPDAQAWFSVVWLGILGSGMAYLAYFRLLGRVGRDPDVARRLPAAGRRDRARLPRAPGADRRHADRRDRAGHRRRRAGQRPVGPSPRCSRRAAPGPPSRLLGALDADRSSAPPTISDGRPDPADGVASVDRLAEADRPPCRGEDGGRLAQRCDPGQRRDTQRPRISR